MAGFKESFCFFKSEQRGSQPPCRFLRDVAIRKSPDCFLIGIESAENPSILFIFSAGLDPIIEATHVRYWNVIGGLRANLDFGFLCPVIHAFGLANQRYAFG